MFGIGMPEMILILAVALIVIGPKKLPDLAKSLGKAMGEFKRATSDLKESMQIDTELKEVKSTFDDLAQDAPASTASDADRWKPPAASAPDDPVADEAPAQAAPSAGNSMDQLKEAFDRRNDETAEVDRGEPAGEPDSADESKPETDKG